MGNLRFSGLKMSNAASPLSHLFFADDIRVMGEASISNVLSSIFDSYCSWSGQASNAAKSTLVISKRANPQLALELEGILNMKAVSEIGTYLGVPLTDGIPRLKHFDKLRARISSKLGAWRARSLWPVVSLLSIILYCLYFITPLLIVRYLKSSSPGFKSSFGLFFGITRRKVASAGNHLSSLWTREAPELLTLSSGMKL